MGKHADAILEAVSRGLRDHPRLVLAVSGGVDSMTLLSAVARLARPGAPVVVANFHHGTGPHASHAATLVKRIAEEAGFRVTIGRASQRHADEASWRRDRWSFLRDVARQNAAVVTTAHTRDDQIETIVMRALRGAGARGLAGLLAAPRRLTPIARPLLMLGRAQIREYADRHALRWIEDPTNLSSAYFRNRVRLDLLPAMRRVNPSIEDELWGLGERAADLRREVEAVSARWVQTLQPGRVEVAATMLGELDAAGRALIWPAVLGEAGIILDARGTRRLAAFSPTARVGGRIQLSGGYEVVRKHDVVAVAPRRQVLEAERPLEGVTTFGPFRFRPAEGMPDEKSPWNASFPAGHALSVRAWRPGDRVRAGPGRALRRVKRFLADAKVVGPDREGWPVVVCNGEIIWVPGLCRSVVARVNQRGPARYFMCERTDG